MIDSFSNYYMQSTNIDRIIEFCKNLYLQIMNSEFKDKLLDPINIAIANLYCMFNFHEINPIVRRYNINYIPSYRIDTLEGYSLIIMNPKEVASRVLKDLELEKVYRLNLVLKELQSLNIFINNKSFFSKISPQFITEFDVCNEILFLKETEQINNPYIEEYESTSSVYDNIVKSIYERIPLTKYNLETIFRHMGNETIIYANPNKDKDLIKHDNISGVIVTPFANSSEVINVCKHFNKGIFIGTGEFI